MEQGTIIWISGPPAAGKSTLCHALAKQFRRTIVIPIDDLREWVVSGYEGPVPWTDLTEEQYRLGEEAACAVAKRYFDAGFTVIIDACRNPRRINEVLAETLPGIQTLKVLLYPEFEENIRRAHFRTNKEFEPNFLDEVIEATHRYFREAVSDDWLIVYNTRMTVEEEVQTIMNFREG